MNERYIVSSCSRTSAPCVSSVRRRGGGEHGIAFELDQGEVGLHAFDDGVEEGGEHRVRGRDALAEVEPVLELDPRHEGRVARDVGQEQVALAGRRLGRGGRG
jgi:hypothetical protein